MLQQKRNASCGKTLSLSVCLALVGVGICGAGSWRRTAAAATRHEGASNSKQGRFGAHALADALKERGSSGVRALVKETNNVVRDVGKRLGKNEHVQKIFSAPLAYVDVSEPSRNLSTERSIRWLRLAERQLSHMMFLPFGAQLIQMDDIGRESANFVGPVSGGGYMGIFEFLARGPLIDASRWRWFNTESPAASFLRSMYGAAGWVGLALNFVGPQILPELTKLDGATTLGIWGTTAAIVGTARAGHRYVRNQQRAKKTWAEPQ